MAKKTVEKPVKVPVKELKPVKETLKYAPVIEINASIMKILTIEGGKPGDKMLLKCNGLDNIYLGKWVITGEGLTHAEFVFEKEWELVSICRL